MEEFFDNEKQEQPTRPEGLKVLCVLSYIGSGLSLFSNLLVFLIFPSFLDFFSVNDLEEISKTFDPEVLLSFVQSAGRMYFLLTAVLYFISVLGVYYMWHLRKNGIHLYAIAQIALLLMPLIFISGNLSILPGLLLTGAFILMYSRYLKIMK